MKQKLLCLIGLLFLALNTRAQVANPAPNLFQCSEVFDLTAQTPIILSDQPVEEFTVGYYESMVDATNAANEISNPSIYVSMSSQTIYARVTKISDGAFAITSFQIAWEMPFDVPDIPDVTACDGYVLVPIPGISYSIDVNGTVPAPSVVTSTMTVYRHLDDFPCAVPSSFIVTIINTPVLYDFPDVTVCYYYMLPPLEFGNYYDQPGGTGNLLLADTFITGSMTVYVYAATGSCTAEDSFQVYINNPIPPPVMNVSACTGYTLPQLPQGYEYFADITGFGFEPVPIGYVITESMPVQVVGDESVCWTVQDFFVFIGGPPYGTPSPLPGCDADGDGYGVFLLEERIGQIMNGVGNLTVSFHETIADAENDTAALTSPYFNTTPNSQTIYARVETYDNCFSTVELELFTQVCGTISGTVRFDSDSNGCTVSDPAVASKQVRYIRNGRSYYSYTNNLGEYIFTDVYPGTFTVSMTAAAGVSSVPSSQVVTVPPGGTPTADFCIVPVAATSDARVYLSASAAARPGFAVGYNIIVFNDGNTPLNGTVDFSFDNGKLDFALATPVAASQTANTLTFDVSGLSPSQYRVFNTAFMVKEPPVVNSGDMLNFSAAMTNSQTDATPANNTALYSQEVVNSYDPNDIMVQQGAFIYQDNMPEELVYTVRFQNTGTASAINIRIETLLDDLLDWNTFRPIAASHAYSVERNYENRVTFRFNGIDLPASETDEPGSHGYVVFAAKPSELMQLGDTISATADIYFDFNAPITTNTVTTQLVELLNIGENELMAVALYPNPATGIVNVSFGQSSENVSITLFDVQGKIIKTEPVLSGNEAVVDISKVQSGLYFVKIEADGKSAVKKLIVE